jgi:hypothetical protein
MTARKSKERKKKTTSKISEMMMLEKIRIRNTKVWFFKNSSASVRWRKEETNQRKLMMMVNKKKII